MENQQVLVLSIAIGFRTHVLSFSTGQFPGIWNCDVYITICLSRFWLSCL